LPSSGDRGLDGTTAQTHAQGTTVVMDFTSSHYTALQNGYVLANNSIAASMLATGAILLGSVVYTSTNSTGSTSPVQLTGVTSTVTIPAGGRKTLILLHCPSVANTNANRTSFLSIWDGVVGSGTQLQSAQVSTTNAAANNPVTAFALVTPAAGSKTYNAGYQTDGAGTLAVNASSTAPVIMMVFAI